MRQLMVFLGVVLVLSALLVACTGPAHTVVREERVRIVTVDRPVTVEKEVTREVTVERLITVEKEVTREVTVDRVVERILTATPHRVPPEAWVLRTDGLSGRPGPVQRGVVDPRGRAYLATGSALYLTDGEGVRRIDEWRTPQEREGGLVLAPGGSVVARLIPCPSWPGLFSIRLAHTSGEHLAELKPREPPRCFAVLYLGHKGDLIVTATPLEDWEGIHGAFRYTFWNRYGDILQAVDRPSRQLGWLDSEGTAIVLLGEQEAKAFSRLGEEMWRLTGRFRHAAVAACGWLALLNPASPGHIDEVHIFDGHGEPNVVQVGTPVHDLRIVPDGSVAVVIGDEGRYFYLDPFAAAAEPETALNEGLRLPIDGTFYITDVEFVDQSTLAFGILQQARHRPGRSHPAGFIIVIESAGDTDRAGFVGYEELYKAEVVLQEEFAFIPAIDVSFESRSVLAYTEDEVGMVHLGR